MLISHVVINLTLAAADIVYMDDVGKNGSVFKLSGQFRAVFQFFRGKVKGFLAMENGGIENLSFHEVLEDMAAIGQLRVIAGAAFFRFADDLEGADI